MTTFARTAPSTATDEIWEHRPPRRRFGGSGLSLNLTAMIDVVFLLLVYFMVGTEFKLGEEVFRLDLPDRQPSMAQADPFDLDDEPLRVGVTSTGIGLNDYAISVEGPFGQPRTFDDLYELLDDRQIRSEVAGGLFEVDHPIVIEPSRTARWEHAIEAYNAAARAAYTNVTFARPR